MEKTGRHKKIIQQKTTIKKAYTAFMNMKLWLLVICVCVFSFITFLSMWASKRERHKSRTMKWLRFKRERERTRELNIIQWLRVDDSAMTMISIQWLPKMVMAKCHILHSAYLQPQIIIYISVCALRSDCVTVKSASTHYTTQKLEHERRKRKKRQN